MTKEQFKKSHIDKSILACFGNFDGSYWQCIECYDTECRRATEKREKEEDD